MAVGVLCLVEGIHEESRVPPQRTVDLTGASVLIIWVFATAVIWCVAALVKPRWDRWRGRESRARPFLERYAGWGLGLLGLVLIWWVTS